MKAIISHETKCTGCQYCEAICSFKNTNTFGYRHSLVTVLTDEERFLYRPTHCKQCDDTPCIKTCPEDIISKNLQNAVAVGLARKDVHLEFLVYILKAAWPCSAIFAAGIRFV